MLAGEGDAITRRVAHAALAVPAHMLSLLPSLPNQSGLLILGPQPLCPDGGPQ